MRDLHFQARNMAANVPRDYAGWHAQRVAGWRREQAPGADATFSEHAHIEAVHTERIPPAMMPPLVEDIGAESIALVNPVAPTTDLVWSTARGTAVQRDSRADGTLSNGTLARSLASQGKVLVAPRRNEPGALTSLLSALDFGSQADRLPPAFMPKPVPPHMLMRIMPMGSTRTFPVHVRWPGFGAALVLTSVLVTPDRDTPPALWFVVHKLLPLGYLPGEPFSQGMYAVHSRITVRLTMAVAGLFPQDNLVLVDDFRGNQWTIEFTTLRQSDDPRYKLMMRELLMQYPALLAETLSTRMLTAPPADLAPGGAVPQGFASLPPVSVRGRPPTAAQAAASEIRL